VKQFHDETRSARAAAAHAVIETAWLVLRMVKAEVGQRQTSSLTFTQMRSLGFLIESPGASLSELAEHLGLQNPTTSKVVEELVQQGWATRDVVPGNRRKLTLSITGSGRQAVELAAEPAMTRMAELLAQLSEKDRETIERAMSLLHPLVQLSGPRDRDETDERSADDGVRSDGKAQRSRTLRRVRATSRSR
jgi:DNA-binding MarR family transcriptional regulator